MRRFLSRRYSLISTSTPDGRSSFISASTVCGVGSRMSSNRLCVRISNCSRDFLSTCGDRRTVQRLIAVGSRTGPATRAPVRRTVSTISLTDRSSSRWSYARSRIRIFWSTSIAMAVDSLLLDLGHDARAHRPTPLPDREPQLLLHRDRRDQRHIHRHVVPRHHHLHPRRQRAHPRHVRRPKVKLRPIPLEKRRVPPPLLLRQHVHLRLEPLVRLDRAGLGEDLAAFDLVLVDPPQQRPDVVPRLPLVHQLPEHLHPGDDRLLRLLRHPHHLHLLPHLHDPPLHPPRHHRPPPRDRKNVLDRHQKRLVHRPHRRRNVTVHRLHQLPNTVGRPGGLRLLHRPQRPAPNHR